MEETPHLVTHFMAAGAEKRLEDYHFLRNTYETITAQEIQLNRILRMLGEDEFSLSWRTDLLPIGRGRSRSVYDFDRWSNALVLQGSMAYERLREIEQDNTKNTGPPTIPSSSRRVQDIRERRQRLSEQRDYPSGSNFGSSSDGTSSSSSRLRALAEYDTALAESEAKRRRQAEENRSNTSKNEDKDVTERRREKFKTTFEDENQKSKNNSDIKPKRQEDESRNRLTTVTHLNEDQDENATKQQKDESSTRLTKNTYSDEDQNGSATKQQEGDKSSHRITKTAYSDEDQNENATKQQEEDESNNRTTKTTHLNEDQDEKATKQQEDESSNRVRKNTYSDEDQDGNATKQQEEEEEDESSDRITKTSYLNDDQDGNATKQQEDESSNHIRKNTYSDEDQNENVRKQQKKDKPSTRLTKNTYSDEDQDNNAIEQEEDKSSNRLTKTANLNEDQDENATNQQENDSDKIRKSSIKSDHEKSGDIELISFTVRCQPIPTSNKDQDEDNPSVRLLCQWASPSSSSAINYFTIERQLGDNEWLPIGEKINKLENKTQLDISSSNDDEINANTPSYFRLKAHLRNGQTFTSKPTDGIFINLSQEKKVIIPDVEILSPSSVQLAWNGNENEDNKNEDNKNEDNENEDNENEEKTNIYDIEKKEEEQESKWEKVTEVPLSQRSARIDSLTDASQCQFRLVPSSSEPEEPTASENVAESEVLTVNNVNEWLSSLHIVPTSPSTVDIDISEEGFKEFDCYKIEYTKAGQLDRWTQMSNITSDDPHLTIDSLKQGTEYKFRFTPVSSDATNETNSSQLSLILDVQMPSARKGRFAKDEDETPVATPPQFSIQKLDATSVLIEAVVPEEEPATFEDAFDVYSKKETIDDDWTKVGTIDKEHLSTTVEDLEENTTYAFKIDNITSPSDDNESNTIQEFKFDITPEKQFDPSLFLEKIEQSLENVVNGVMQAAAGHQTLDEPVNRSLNEVIKEVFRDEALVPNEKYGFDTLELNNDLQVYRGPKQMMLKDLEIDETIDLSKHYGEIIIHNYRKSQQSVIVREENGNTRVGNIDGDIIIRNVVSDVVLKNEQTHHQLTMNIVGQAFLKGVQGTLLASKFKGIIVVKNVNKP